MDMSDGLKVQLKFYARKVVILHGCFSPISGARHLSPKETYWVGDGTNAWSVADALAHFDFDINTIVPYFDNQKKV